MPSVPRRQDGRAGHRRLGGPRLGCGQRQGVAEPNRPPGTGWGGRLWTRRQDSPHRRERPVRADLGLARGQTRRKLELGDKRGTNIMDVSADGKRAEIIIGGERALRFYDLNTGKELPPAVQAHRGPVYGGVALASDSQLISAGLDNTIRVWDLRTGRHLPQICTNYPVGASTLAVSADGRLIATADFNRGQVVLHQRDTGKAARTIETGGQQVFHVAFAPTGKLLAVSGDKVAAGGGASEPFLSFWDADNGREIRRQPVDRPGAMAFNPDGQSVARLGKDEVRLWDVATGRQQRMLPQKEPRCLALSPDGRMLACGDDHFKSVTLWELASGKERGRIEAPPKGAST